MVAPRFFSEKDDALAQKWWEISGDVWLNPPFGNIAPWAEKCAASLATPSSCSLFPLRRIFFLVPAAVGSNWYAHHVHDRAGVKLLNGRLCFDGKNSFPKDCLLAVYGEAPGYEVWRWR